MKHYLYFFIATCLCITTISIAMEEELPKEEKSNILAEITAIKKPRHVQYLTNNRVIIAGKGGCSIIDPTTNKKIKEISNISTHHLATHPNKKLFALTQKKSINIYDIEKKLFTWSKT